MRIIDVSEIFIEKTDLGNAVGFTVTYENGQFENIHAYISNDKCNNLIDRIKARQKEFQSQMQRGYFD